MFIDFQGLCPRRRFLCRRTRSVVACPRWTGGQVICHSTSPPISVTQKILDGKESLWISILAFSGNKQPTTRSSLKISRQYLQQISQLPTDLPKMFAPFWMGKFPARSSESSRISNGGHRCGEPRAPSACGVTRLWAASFIKLKPWSHRREVVHARIAELKPGYLGPGEDRGRVSMGFPGLTLHHMIICNTLGEALKDLNYIMRNSSI